MSKRLERLHRALSAKKMAAMTRLAAKIAEANAARARAAAFRRQSRSLQAPEISADMVQQGQWQGQLERRARHADAQALEFDAEADALRPELAQALGRDQVVEGMIDQARKQAQRDRERRDEERAIANYFLHCTAPDP